MKIRDLLAAESIELNGKVTGKKEALDAMVDLMAKSGKINEKRRAPQESARELRFRTANRIRCQDRGLQRWSYRKGLTLIP
mgnify:CR=1 FL=1